MDIKTSRETTEQERLFYTLGAHNAKLDAILLQLQKIEMKHDDHDARLDHLENWRSRVLGVVAGVSLMVSAAVTSIVPLLRAAFDHTPTT